MNSTSSSDVSSWLDNVSCAIVDVFQLVDKDDEKVSISATFYARLFHTNVFFKAFFYSQFGCVIFWQNNIIEKASHKMLVKLTEGQWRAARAKKIKDVSYGCSYVYAYSIRHSNCGGGAGNNRFLFVFVAEKEILFCLVSIRHDHFMHVLV